MKIYLQHIHTHVWQVGELANIESSNNDDCLLLNFSRKIQNYAASSNCIKIFQQIVSPFKTLLN